MNDKNKESWQNIIKMKLSKNTSNNKPEDINMTNNNMINSIIANKNTTTPTHKSQLDAKPLNNIENLKIKVFVNKFGTITIKPSNRILTKLLYELDDTVYDLKCNEWRISVKSYNKIKKDLKTNKFIFNDIPKGVLKILERSISEKDYALNGEIYNKMFEFQKNGVIYALNRGGRVILGDDMGLGKTIQALGIAYHYRMEWPLLILSPASLLDNWCESINQFLQMESRIIRSRTDFGERISIISYDICSKLIDFVKIMKYGVIIVDECHYLKSNTSKRTKNILPVLQDTNRLILISGTPAVSRPVELFTIFSALQKSLFPTFNEYGMRYCNGRKIRHWYDFKGCTNAEELNYILNKYFMIRRLKEEVLSQLPPKTRRQIIIDCGKKLEIKNMNLVGDIIESTVMSLYNDAVNIKLEPVKLYIETILERNIKFVIFAHHATMIEGLSDFLKERKVNFIKIDGSVISSNRHKLVKDFQDNDNIRVALLSITACSTGLTLTAGKLVIFAELYWNPGTLLQAEDRIHRIGQDSSVDIHYLVCKGSVDEYVWPILITKLNVLQSLGIGKNNLKNVEHSKYDSGQTSIESYIHKIDK